MFFSFILNNLFTNEKKRNGKMHTKYKRSYILKMKILLFFYFKLGFGKLGIFISAGD